MVGGTVIETVDHPTRDKIWINCQDDHGTTCAIYVAKDDRARTVSEGDSVWWQGRTAFWTPKDSKGKAFAFNDLELKRIGFSGVSRPESAEASS